MPRAVVLSLRWSPSCEARLGPRLLLGACLPPWSGGIEAAATTWATPAGSPRPHGAW